MLAPGLQELAHLLGGVGGRVGQPPRGTPGHGAPVVEIAIEHGRGVDVSCKLATWAAILDAAQRASALTRRLNPLINALK